jgi:hypothetical protein
MHPGREIDTRVAQEIFGYEVFIQNQVLQENSDKGVRPLKNYSQDMEWAWQIGEKLRVSLIPVENNQWFAFVGPEAGWSAPEAFLEYLRGGDFTMCGAAVHVNAAQAICEAALVANQKRKLAAGEELASSASSVPEADTNNNPSLH